jgi:PBP1b-binding outer membrane lipoprotein LpoB
MRSVAILTLTALALSACSGGNDTQATDEPVEAAALATDAEPAEAQPTPSEDTATTPSPADTQAPTPATTSNAASPDPADPDAVGEQYQDYVGGEQD